MSRLPARYCGLSVFIFSFYFIINDDNDDVIVSAVDVILNRRHHHLQFIMTNGQQLIIDH